MISTNVRLKKCLKRCLQHSVLRILVGLMVFCTATVSYAEEAPSIIPVKKFYNDIDEASKALQSILKELVILPVTTKKSRGVYITYLVEHNIYVPVESFVILPKGLKIFCKITQTQTPPELVDNSITFALDRISLLEELRPPHWINLQRTKYFPYWAVHVIVHYPDPDTDPEGFLLGTSSKETAEILYNSLLSLMAAAGNPYVSNEKIPPTLTFEKIPSTSISSKEKLSKTEMPSSPKLGFSVIPVPEPNKKGLVVIKVESGSPAEISGLKAGDIFLSINGTDVNNVQEIPSLLQPYENHFKVLRKGKIIEIKIVVPASF